MLSNNKTAKLAIVATSFLFSSVHALDTLEDPDKFIRNVYNDLYIKTVNLQYDLWKRGIWGHPRSPLSSIVSKTSSPSNVFTDYFLFTDSLIYKTGARLSMEKVKLNGDQATAVAHSPNFTEYNTIFVGQNSLINNSAIEQTLTTSSYSKAITETTTTTTTHGWKSGLSNTTAIKGTVAVKIPLINAQSTIENSTNISLEYNGSSATAVTNTTMHTYTIGTQNIKVPPHCKAEVNTSLGTVMSKGEYTIMIPFSEYHIKQTTTEDSWVNLRAMLSFVDSYGSYNQTKIPEEFYMGYPMALKVKGKYETKHGSIWNVALNLSDISPNSCKSLNKYVLDSNQSIKSISNIQSKDGIRSKSYAYQVMPQKLEEKTFINSRSGVFPWAM